ncbi:MAG: DUF2680 domain-containing protein [Bacillota bacterium]
MFRKRYFTGIVVASILLIVAVAGVAFAGSNSQINKPDRAALHQDFIAKFASNLGVDQAKVTEALEVTKKQMLDESVEKGYLTREQADKMAARKDIMFGNGGFHKDKQDFGDRGRKFNSMGNDMEKILGITPEQFKEELKSGKSLQQIVADHGLTMEQFNQKMLEIKKEALAKAVADGKMTQEQYDNMIKKMEQRFK